MMTPIPATNTLTPRSAPHQDLRIKARAYLARYFMTTASERSGIRDLLRQSWGAQPQALQAALPRRIPGLIRECGGYLELSEPLRWFVDIYVLSKFMANSGLEELWGIDAEPHVRRFTEGELLGLDARYAAPRMKSLQKALEATAAGSMHWRPQLYACLDIEPSCICRPGHDSTVQGALRSLLELQHGDARARATYLLRHKLLGWKLLSAFDA